MDIASMVRKRPMLLGSLILSVVSALMLLLDDFAVWSEPYYYSDYGFYEVEAGWVYITEGPLYVLLFLGLAGLLLFAAWVSVQGLLAGDGLVPAVTLRRGMWAAAAVSLTSFLGGMIFLIVMASEDPYDWWLDTGFYGGFLLGGLAALLLFLQGRAEERTRQVAAAPARRPPSPAPAPAPAPQREATPQQRTCPACSAPARQSDKFCQRCGTRLPAQ